MRRLQLTVPMLLLLTTACAGNPQQAVPQPTRPTATASPGAPTGPRSPGAQAFDSGKLSSWSGCGRDFQCAKLTVALDPATPGLGNIAIALTRHRATGSKRVGSLVINPGGPGASAVDYLKSSYNAFPAAVRAAFDLVAFDPRGVGHTAPVRCLSTGELDRYFHLDPVPDDSAELRALDAANREFVQGCQQRSGKVLPYVGTEIVADDLERVRIAVGDAKLSYLGYSYGTAIGAAYLDAYPTHVRAMVLDGALDPSLTWDQLLTGQGKGFEGALEAFLADCEKIRCEFRQAVKGDLHAAFDAIAHRVETKPLPGKGNRTVGPGEFSYGVGAGLYSRASGWPAIARALALATRGDGSILLALNDIYLERDANGYTNIIQANSAVNCIDRPWPRSDGPFQALAQRLGTLYPRFGAAIALGGLNCSVWPVPPVSSPHKVVAATSPTVVVIGTIRDPATPYSWAQALAGQLKHGVLLTYNGDGHTVYRSGAPRCITRPVNDYLISLTEPAPATC